MKFKLLITSALLLLSINVMSQALWVMIFGDKLSNDRMQSGIVFSVAGVDYVGLEDAKPDINWALGGFSEIRINKENLFFAFDFTVKSPLGTRNLNNYFPDVISDSSFIKSQNITLENTSFSLPLYLKYKTKHFGFGAGTQLNYIYKSKLKYDAKTTAGKTILIVDKGKSYINLFDLGVFLMTEVMVTPKHPKTSMRIGLRYYYGLLNPLKDFSGVHNSTLMVSLSIPIGGKEEVK